MKTFIILAGMLLLSACGEYIPRTVFEIKDVEGNIIKLACPVVEMGRSTLTYLIDGECLVYKTP